MNSRNGLKSDSILSINMAIISNAFPLSINHVTVKLMALFQVAGYPD